VEDIHAGVTAATVVGHAVWWFGAAVRHCSGDGASSFPQGPCTRLDEWACVDDRPGPAGAVSTLSAATHAPGE